MKGKNYKYSCLSAMEQPTTYVATYVAAVAGCRHRKGLSALRVPDDTQSGMSCASCIIDHFLPFASYLTTWQSNSQSRMSFRALTQI